MKRTHLNKGNSEKNKYENGKFWKGNNLKPDTSEKENN